MNKKQVALSFNVKNGVYIANALAQAGILNEFFTTPVFRDDLNVRDVTKIFKRFVNKRSMPIAQEVDPTNLYIPDIILHGLPRIPGSRPFPEILARAEKSFDRAVARRLSSPILHFASGVGSTSLNKVNAAGGLGVCHRRALHHEVEEQVVMDAIGEAYVHPEREMGDALTYEYQNASYILCNSKLTADSFVSTGTPQSKISTIHNGVDTMRFSPSEGKSETNRKLSLLYVGSLDLRKGVDLLGRLCANLHDNIRMRVAGRVLESDAAKSVLGQPNVEYLGVLSTSRIIEEYRMADLLVLPSRADAFGYVVSEALACGTPVVVSDMCGASEVITDGVEGQIFESGNSEALESAVMTYHSRERLADAAHAARDLRPYLGWDRYGRELTSFYENVVFPSLVGSG